MTELVDDGPQVLDVRADEIQVGDMVAEGRRVKAVRNCCGTVMVWHNVWKGGQWVAKDRRERFMSCEQVRVIRGLPDGPIDWEAPGGPLT